MGLVINSTTVFEDGVMKKSEAPKAEKPKKQVSKQEPVKAGLVGAVVKKESVKVESAKTEPAKEALKAEKPQSKTIIDGSQIKLPSGKKSRRNARK